MATRDVRFSRLRLPTINDDISEAVGDQLETVGGGVVAGERQARSFRINLPIYGAFDETDPYTFGLRARKQVRSLMENSRVKLQGMYFSFDVDTDLNSWLLVGSGDLQYDTGGISIANFKLSLNDVFRVGTRRTHRPARRVELYDRRDATTARDILGQVFATDWASLTPIALVYLPVGVSDVIGVGKRIVPVGTRLTVAGDISVAAGLAHGEVLSFEWPDASIHLDDDVVIYDRQGILSVPISMAASVISYQPRGFWRFRETAGASIADDVSDYSNTSTYIGTPYLERPTPTGDTTDYSVGLNGAEGIYVRVNDAAALDITGDLTVMAWVAPVEGQTMPVLAKWLPTGNQRSYRLGVNGYPDPQFSGNELTDATRANAFQGDGLTDDSSYGIWPATTNQVTNGSFVTNTTGWASVSSTIARVTTEGKFGSTALRIITSNATGTEGAQANAVTTGVASGDIWSASAWIKGTSGTARIRIREYSNAGGTTLITTHSSADVTITSSWQRITITSTALNAAVASLRLEVSTNSQQNITFYIDGCQLEEKTYATPYVETDGASASRSAARIQMPAGLLNATQGWFAARFRMGHSNTQNSSYDRLLYWYTDANNAISVRYNNTNDTFGTYRVGAGTAGTAETGAQTFSAGTMYTLIGAWDATNVKVSINGAAFTSAGSSVVPTMTVAAFDVGSTGTIDQLSGELMWCACGTGALTDGNAATINSFGNNDPTLADLPGTPTMVWAANSSVYETTKEIVMQLSSNGTAEFTAVSSNGTCPTDGSWTHIVAVYAASTQTVTFYKNGTVLNAVSSAPASVYSSTARLMLGRWESDG